MTIRLMAPGPFAHIVYAALPDLPICHQIQAGEAGVLSRTADAEDFDLAVHLRRVIEHGPNLAPGDMAVYDPEPQWQGEPVLREAMRCGSWPLGYLDTLAASVCGIRAANPGSLIGLYGMPMDWRPYMASGLDAEQAWQRANTESIKALRVCDFVAACAYDRTDSLSTRVDDTTAYRTGAEAKRLGLAVGIPTFAYVSAFYDADQGPSSDPPEPIPLPNWRARLEALRAAGVDGLIVWIRATTEAWALHAARVYQGPHGDVMREVFQ